VYYPKSLNIIYHSMYTNISNLEILFVFSSSLQLTSILFV